MLSRPERTPTVTYHAVERFCQRILGVKVHIKPHELPSSTPKCNSFRAHRHCEAAGLTYEQVVALILTPNVVMACRGGYRNMRTRDFIAVMDGNGTVVTVKKLRARPGKIGRSHDYLEQRRCR